MTKQQEMPRTKGLLPGHEWACLARLCRWLTWGEVRGDEEEYVRNPVLELFKGRGGSWSKSNPLLRAALAWMMVMEKLADERTSFAGYTGISGWTGFLTEDDHLEPRFESWTRRLWGLRFEVECLSGTMGLAAREWLLEMIRGVSLLSRFDVDGART